VCGYQSELAWAGDQGLFLGGLVDRMLVVGRDSPDYAGLLDLATAIALGVKSQIDAHHGGILTAWVTETDGGDPGDYDTGVAVYMRYLLYAYQAKDRAGRYLLRDVLKDMGYVDFVCKNTANVMNNYKNHSSVVDLTNDLAMLVAAVVMSKSAWSRLALRAARSAAHVSRHDGPIGVGECAQFLLQPNLRARGWLVVRRRTGRPKYLDPTEYP
jgi:hypothetical protein